MLMLHDHAEELLKKITSHENVTNPESFGKWSPEEQQEVHRILNTCNKVFFGSRLINMVLTTLIDLHHEKRCILFGFDG